MARVRTFVALTFLLFFGVPAWCDEFEKRYGVGTIHIEPYNYFSLDFWRSPTDAMPFEQVYFFRDSLQDRLHFQFAMTGKDTAPSWFEPEVFHVTPEMKRIDFFCLQRDGDWCKVIVNRTTGETKWLELGVDVRFVDWNGFFRSVATVQIVTGEGILYEKPDERSKTSKVLTKPNDSWQRMEVQKVEGAWMFVEITERDGDYNETGRRSGWIRWRNENELLVTYNLMGC